MRGKLEVEGAGRAATCEQLTGRREPCCQLCLRRAGGRLRRPQAPAGVVRPRRPQGPAARRGTEPSYPAARRLLRAAGGERGPRLPARAPPRLSSRRSPAPSTNQRGRRALTRPLRAGSRGPPSSPPCSLRAPGMLRAGSAAVWTPLRGTEISLKQCRARKFICRKARAGRLNCSRSWLL